MNSEFPKEHRFDAEGCRKLVVPTDGGQVELAPLYSSHLARGAHRHAVPEEGVTYATALPTRVRGETDIPEGAAWAPPSTLVQLEYLLKVMRRWVEVAEQRHA